MACGPESTAIVIPQRGAAELTWQLCRAIRAHERRSWPIVVVDDGTPDLDAERLSGDEGCGAALVRQEGRGVSAAWNAGARRVPQAEFVIWLNNDVVCRGAFVEALIAPLELGAAAVSGAEWREERLLPEAVLSRWPTRRFLSGWCLATRRAVWEELGGFDEELTVYWSDTDFQLRAWRGHEERGTPALYAVPGLPLRHLGHRTTGRQPDRRARWLQDRRAFLAKQRGCERPEG